ncbi:MAG: extracellular solute-binding protein [Spirochaetales bacterium]|nr:extracellular solute-binding protein [Spirochaetales bacterium]
MNISKQWPQITVFLFLLLSTLHGTGQEEQSSSYSGREGKITVYISGPEEMVNQLETSFEAERGDVLELINMGGGALRQRVWTESESGGIQADLFWGTDPLIYMALDEKGALEEYRSPEYDNLKEIYQLEGNYTIVNERYGVVIYNKDEMKDNPPRSFADLTSPVYKDKLVHADPAQSSTALALIAGLWDLTGTDGEFHKGLIENGLFLSKKNSDVPSKIQEGEFTAGIAPHDTVIRLQKKAKKDGYPTPLAIAWPEEGAVAIQRPVAISKNPARPEANQILAREFVDFLLSQEAQAIGSRFAFVSAREDMPPTAGVPEDLTIRRVDWTVLSENQYNTSDAFKALFR